MESLTKKMLKRCFFFRWWVLVETIGRRPLGLVRYAFISPQRGGEMNT